MEQPVVSVLSPVYNQAEYVEDMMRGFVRQETDFKVEFLIHDDASTDGTQEILKRYEEKYPDLFTIIYESENQWSKGVRISQNILLPIARGKYIAFCEGDDFWIDKNKLQEQKDFLDAHPEYVCVAHNALIWECDKNVIQPMNNYETSRCLQAKDILPRKHPTIATASKMSRKEVMYLDSSFPDCGEVCDMPADFYAFTRGKIYYIDKIMSVYRYGSKGSFSSRMKEDILSLINWCVIRTDFLRRYNEYTNGEYQIYIQEYMTRGIHDVLCHLIKDSISKTEFESMIDRIDEKTKGKYEAGIREVRRQADILVYGDDDKTFDEIDRWSLNHRIFLYGAGNFGKETAKRLNEKGIDFEGFLVSDTNGSPETVLGKKVFGIDEYINSEDDLIIVSTSVHRWEQIFEILAKYEIKNYMYPLLADPGKM